MSVDPLLTAFTVRSLTLRNRIVSTSHEPAYSEDGLAKDRYRAYHVAKAKGGVALTMIGGSAVVSRGSTPAFGNLQLWKDESVPWLRRLADEVHEQGAAVMIQLTHLGHRTSAYTHDWLPAVSASAVREPAHRAFAKQAEAWDLEQVERDFVAATQRCVEAGLDGVELMMYGHLLDAFWTPYWNHRDDEYGGSYDNRMRFPLSVVRAVRAALPDEGLLAARIAFDEQRDGGLGLDESLTVARDVVDAGVDLISAVRGSIESDASLARMIPPMGTPSAPHLDALGQLRDKLGVPVMHAARIADVATARYAVEAGLLDLVGMTRALLADPSLPAKVAAGQEDRIRPCVGAAMCIDSIYTSGAAYCIHNPSTGRELELPQDVTPAPRARRVAVVGGGPAGLEAARVLGERGHEVTLFEAGDRLGGQLVLAAGSPRRRDLLGIVDWRRDELRRLGVTVRLGAYVGPDELAAGDWDVVVVATGGVPAAPDVPGAALVADSWDVLSGARRLSGDVLVYDDHGGNQALDVTEALVRDGATVELLTPERTVSPDVGGIVAAGYLAALAEAGVPVTVLRRLREVRRRADGRLEAVLGIDGSGWTETRVVDAVVAEAGTLPVTDVYDGLVAGSTNGGEVDLDDLLARRPQTAVRNPDGGYQLFRIGDAVASRNVHAAMLDAARLAHAI